MLTQVNTLELFKKGFKKDEYLFSIS